MKKCLFSFIILLQFLSLGADNYYCKNIGIANGLSQSSVTSVVYDDNGTLWIGTRYGLNEYRNGKLRTLLDDGSGKISGNHVNLLYCDSRHNVWMSTDKGIFRYDTDSDSFILYDNSPAYCATETSDCILFGCHNGISRYDLASDRMEPGTSEVYMDYVMLGSYGDAVLAIERKDGIHLIKDGVTDVIHIEELGGNLIMAAARTGKTLFLAVMNLGLVQYDLDSRCVVRIFKSGHDGLPSELILSLLVNKNHLIIGTDGAGLRILDIESMTIHSMENLHDTPWGDSLPISITTLYMDPLSNLWIGSVRGGLVGLKQSPIKFITMATGRIQEENTIISLHSSYDGHLYIGTDGNGVKRYNAESTETLSYPRQHGMKVTAIEDFDSDRLIVSLYNSGIFLMNRETGSMTPFTIIDEKTNAAECLNSNAPTIYDLGDSRLLLLAVNTYLYDKRTGTFRIFKDETGENGKELIVLGPAEGNSYYAYSSFGLFRINIASMTVSLIFKASVETGNIGTAVLHNDMIHFGTNYGLFAFNTKSESVSKIDSELFRRVSKLYYSAGGNLWVGADNTLFLYRGGVFEMVGENRGVPANEFLACESSGNGCIYFGGTAGLLEIGSSYSYESMENKQILLHDVSVTGKRIVAPEGVLKLRHNYSSLIMTVNLAGADPFEKIMYRYNVNGKNGFTSETFEDILEIPGLKQGKYQVDASYLMADGRWSTPETVLSLRVSPPWYKSIPMILVYVLLLLTGIWFSVEAISRARLEKMQAELRLKDLAFNESLMQFINENMGDPNLNVAEIAKNMAMSRAALYYKVNASLGKGVAELIEERRMATAEDLLKTSPLSVLDISEKVGYSTSRYFSTRFKQLHDGMTPLKYRQKFKE